MKLTMKPATEEDRAFFVDVHHQSYRQLVTMMYGWNEELQDEFANKAFDDGDDYIIWWHDEEVGVISWLDRGDDLRVIELMILPEFQGKGIASQVLKEMQQEAAVRQKPLRLKTVKVNQRAYNLYLHHGFREEGYTQTHVRMVWVPPMQEETEEDSADTGA